MRISQSVRIGLVIFLAAAVSLPIAFVSLAKLLLFAGALFFLLGPAANETTSTARKRLTFPWIILACVGIWALSVLMTATDQEQSFIALVKHGKLLTIPLIVFLVRTRKEALCAIAVLLVGQTFVQVCSWLMASNVPLPWAPRPSGPGPIETQFVPFADSYLDQSVMLATTAGILWYLANQGYLRWARIFSLTGLLNVVVLMPGRTGYVLALCTACLITMHEIPKRWRVPAAIVTPLLLVSTLLVLAPQFQQRVALAVHELSAYEKVTDGHTSVGARLNMWKLSINAISQSPFVGVGVGNWATTIKRLEGPDANAVFGSGIGSNPHQELLLWTVELGAVGTLLFLALFAALAYDTRFFSEKNRWAFLSVILMLAITCLFNSPLYDDLIGDYFCVAIGLLIALGLQENQNNQLAMTRPY